MSNDQRFRRIRRRRRRYAAAVRPSQKVLLELLTRQVIRRFVRLSGGGPTAIPLSLGNHDDTEDPPANPGHPDCREFAGTDYCRESWQLHMARLRAEPETHWHRCDYDRLCALVPVVHGGRCLAVIKLACPLSTSAAEFERHVELLDILARDFALSQAGFLARLSDTAQPASDAGMLPAGDAARPALPPSNHPQVVKALQCVAQQLSDPKLTVAGVARQVGVHPNYLSHLFAEQTGQRLGRLIALRRVEQAKLLLTTTPMPIKDVARDVGFANPNWFSYVFRALTGLAPSEYRKQHRGAARAASHRMAPRERGDRATRRDD